MKIWNFIFTAVFAAGLTGCAHHQMMRGSVAMKANEREAHVCLGEDEVKVGDSVTAFRNACTLNSVDRAERGTKGVTCKLEKIGRGKVVSLLNNHYSTVEFDRGVPFEEGTVVQKE